MNQTEQVTSVTGVDIDVCLPEHRQAAIRDERIAALEEQAARDRTQVVANAAAIHVAGGAIHDSRQQAALIEEQRLQVIANTAVIKERSDTIHALRVRCADHVRRIVELERLTDRLVDRQVVNGKRIEKLEQRMEMVIRSIVAIETVEALSRRIKKLEAALNFGDGATYTAEHARQIEDWSGGTI